MKVTFLLSLFSFLWLCSGDLLYAQLQNEGIVYSDEMQEPVFYFAIDSARCSYSNDGSIMLWNGNDMIDSLKWENGERSFERLGLSAGVYTATVYFHYGVVYSYDFLISSPAALETTIERQLLKIGVELSATVVGGTAPYAYLWSNGNENNGFTVGSPGEYSLEITDSKGCVSQKSIIIDPSEGNLAIETEQITVIQNEPGAFTVQLNKLDYEVYCFAMNGQEVKPQVLEESSIEFNQLSKGYYFLVGRIGATEVKEMVYVLQ